MGFSTLRLTRFNKGPKSRKQMMKMLAKRNPFTSQSMYLLLISRGFLRYKNHDEPAANKQQIIRYK
jgi:hypothetical protein